MRERDIDDWFKGGVLLRAWSWVEIAPAQTDEYGEEVTAAVYGARCVDAPLNLLTATDQEITDQLTANAAVRALVAAAEPEPDEIEVPVFDGQGNQTGVDVVEVEAPAAPPAIERAGYWQLRKLAYVEAFGSDAFANLDARAIDGIGNVLDAEYWSRNESSAPQAAVDAAIAQIKAKFPKPT